MALNESEQQIWDKCVKDLRLASELDPIEQAARDTRLQCAFEVIMGVREPGHEYDFETLRSQIAGDYLLGLSEVLRAFDLAEDRIIREQT